MKGKTNSQTGGIRGERVNILLVTNRASHDDVKGAVVSIAYENVVDQYTYNGSMLSAKVPPYVDYTISVSDVEGYAKPATVSATSVAGNSRSVTMTYNTTVVSVSMSSNQGDLSDISGATATVTAAGITDTTVSSGGSVKVPMGATCTVTWSDVSGYKTPNAQSFIAGSSNITKMGLYQTEILTVNVTSDIDLPSSYTVTVSGIGSQTTASKVYKVPFGTSYTVSATAADGYKTPTTQSFTASQVSRTVSVEYLEYTEPRGVFIQDILGNLYTESEWDGSKTPNGIAVITDNCRFVMALADAHTTYCEWGGYGTEVSSIVTTTNESIAITDYDGDLNTTAILGQLGDSSSSAPAAYYCLHYRFPNGDRGYMGAAGEWQAALDNKDAITSALSKCGGTSMNSYYWTSTQYSSYFSWCMYWYYEDLDYDNKYNNNYVRAFAVI